MIRIDRVTAGHLDINARRRLKAGRNNLFVVAVSVGFGMIPLVAPTFFKQMPHALHPLLEAGILLCAIAAVTLNLFFNGLTSNEAAREAAKHQAASSEH